MRTGAALKGFAAGAIAASRQPEHPQVAYGWWVSFLHWVADNAVWLGKLVAFGEVVIGVALILGLFTGIFAFGGLVLNFSYVFSGMPAGSGWTASCCRGSAPPGSRRSCPRDAWAV
jgi:thiosulfate dehydrogenase [quinone] large subunit